MIGLAHSESNVSPVPPGNPLMEGITLPKSAPEIVRMLASNRFHDANWRTANRDPNHLKINIRRTVIPTRSLIRVAKDIFRLLAEGYYARNPSDPDRLRLYHSNGHSMAHEVRMLEGDLDSIGICGITGTGKSHVIKAVLNSLPRMFVRRNMAAMDFVKQVVWLRIDMTTAGTQEAFADSILTELQDALEDPDLFERTTRGVRSLDARLRSVKNLLKTHFCGMLVVDEVQERNFAGESKFKIRDLLVQLANLNIAVVVVGNPLAFGPEGNPDSRGGDQKFYSQPLRRMFHSEQFRLDPASDVGDLDWNTLVRGLWPCQILPVIAPLSDEIKHLLYNLTGGFPGFLENLLTRSQHIALDEKALSLSPEHLRRAAIACFGGDKKQVLIDAFVKRDPFLLRLCNDIDHAYYEKKWGLMPPQNSAAGPGVGTVMDQQSSAYSGRSRETQEKVQRTAKASVTKSKLKASREKPNATSLLSDYHQEKLKELIQKGTTDS